MVVVWIEDLFQLIGSHNAIEFRSFVSRNFMALSVSTVRLVQYVFLWYLHAMLQAMV